MRTLVTTLVTPLAAAALLAGCGMKSTPAAVSAARAAQARAAAKAPEAFLRIDTVTVDGLPVFSGFNAPPNRRLRLQARVGFGTPTADLTWSWRAWGPIFGFNDRAEWTTPGTEGTYTVDVQVRDRQGGWDWKTLYCRVAPQAELTAFDATDADREAAQGPTADPSR